MATTPGPVSGANERTEPLRLPRELRENLVEQGFPQDELRRLVARPRRRNGLLRALRRDLLGL
jgi:hypothetical protein